MQLSFGNYVNDQNYAKAFKRDTCPLVGSDNDTSGKSTSTSTLTIIYRIPPTIAAAEVRNRHPRSCE
jgi:hypothetical protein